MSRPLDLNDQERGFVALLVKDWIDNYSGSVFPKGASWDDVAESVMKKMEETRDDD